MGEGACGAVVGGMAQRLVDPAALWAAHGGVGMGDLRRTKGAYVQQVHAQLGIDEGATYFATLRAAVLAPAANQQGLICSAGPSGLSPPAQRLSTSAGVDPHLNIPDLSISQRFLHDALVSSLGDLENVAPVPQRVAQSARRWRCALRNVFCQS